MITTPTAVGVPPHVAFAPDHRDRKRNPIRGEMYGGPCDGQVIDLTSIDDTISLRPTGSAAVYRLARHSSGRPVVNDAGHYRYDHAGAEVTA